MNARDLRNTVLVVDDEPQVLAAIQDTLEHEFQVLVETSAQAAIKVLENERDLSVILSDQRMPGMSGDEFLARAKEISDATRVMITGFADLEAVIRAVNLGKIFGYVSKPWNPEHLKLLVYKAVEHYQLQQELHEEQRLLHNLMHNIPDAIFFKDLDHRYLRVNGAQARRLLLGSPSEAVGKRATEILPGEQAERWEKRDAELLESGIALTDRIEKFEEGPGRASWFSVTEAPVRDEKGRIVRLVGIARDITERKEAEEKIRRLNRGYAVLSGINTLIVRVRDRQELFREACRIAVEHGGFEIAWIGRYDPQTLDVTPVAWAGMAADDFLATQTSTARDDVPQGQGAIGRAVRERRPVWVNDIAAASNGAGPRRKELARRGFRSVIALPLIVDGPVSAEVVSVAKDEMIPEARELAKIHKNVVVKIPLIVEWLKAVKVLSAEGIRVNVTLCFSASQALLAAKAGATYISPFIGRLDDICYEGMAVIRDIKQIYLNYGFKTKILTASVRNPLHVLEAAKAGADIATLPFTVLQQLVKHPLTDIGLKRFLADWDKYAKENLVKA